MTETELVQHYKTLEARFDRAAKVYDATYASPSDSGHGNALMGWLRDQHTAVLRDLLPDNASLIDIGSGTGEEAIKLVAAGYSVLGIDISPAMIRQAQTKAAVHGLRRGISFRQLEAGKLDTLDERGPFQGAYAGLGTLNTEPNLPGVAKGLHGLLEQNAPFVATVMNRRCLFDILYHLRRLKPGQTMKRHTDWHEGWASGGVTALVRFLTPSAFAAAFEPYFVVESVRAFPLWLPPVYMHEVYCDNPARFQRAERRDERMRSWPVLRGLGDHFLMVLRHTMPPDEPNQANTPNHTE
ncbi:MAG: methyltransferase domain-containing protein [Anaerolineae bacterium]|nr:methyltransferase domain-containing protein [Anaerolineae bacterium]